MTSPQYFAVNFYIGKSYRNLLYTEDLTYDETSRMLETSKEYIQLQPDASDAAQFTSFIKYVEENRFPSQCKNLESYKRKQLEQIDKVKSQKQLTLNHPKPHDFGFFIFMFRLKNSTVLCNITFQNHPVNEQCPLRWMVFQGQCVAKFQLQYPKSLTL